MESPRIGQKAGVVYRPTKRVERVESQKTKTQTQVDSVSSGFQFPGEKSLARFGRFLQRNLGFGETSEVETSKAESNPSHDRAREVLGGLTKDSLFHATNSDALKGLAESKSLLSAAQLDQAKIERETGEGTTIFTRAKRDFISFGAGQEGFGAVLKYEESSTKPPISYRAVPTLKLACEMSDLQSTLNNERMPELSGPNGWIGVDKVMRSRVDAMQAELTRREQNPNEEAPYPLILQMKGEGLNTFPSSDVAGEMRTTQAVSLEERLERVLVPEDKIPHMKKYLQTVLGPENQVEVLSTESFKAVKEEFTDTRVAYKRTPNGDHWTMAFDEVKEEIKNPQLLG